MTDTEKRYAQIEKEMLAIVFAIQRFHHYIYGIDVTLHSDHKPLESIQHKEPSKVSPRLQNMLMKLLCYRIDIVYKPGKQMHITDVLSRAHLQSKSPAADRDSDMRAVHTFMYAISNKALDEYKKASLQDEVSQQIRRYLKGKWPNGKTLSSALQMYYDLREQIYEEDDLLFLGSRLIVPRAKRRYTLQQIHNGHQGIEKCKSFPHEDVYWPEISKGIETKVSKCTVCQKYKGSNIKEPINQHEIPEQPWEKLAADIFTFGMYDYLVVVDYY